MSRPAYRPKGSHLHRLQAAGVAFFVTLLMFLMLPLTQFLGHEPEDFVTLTPVDYAEPPPKADLKEEPPPEEKLRDSLPELEKPPSPKPSLASLRVSLDIGPSYFEQAFELGDFGLAPDASKDLIFEIADLDRQPRCIRKGSLIYPAELKRFQLSGEVRLLILISKEGRVKVLEVEKSAHPAFDRAAIRAAETSLYESPLKDGEPVAVRFFLPVKFKFRN